MRRTVDLNLGSFSLAKVASAGGRQGNIVMERCDWHIGPSLKTEEFVAEKLIIVFLLNEQKLPFGLDLCMDISNICNSRQMFPYVVTATDCAQWYRSGLETIMVPPDDQLAAPADIEKLLAPDLTIEISKFITVFGRGVCRYGNGETGTAQ
jgi:hypothetical protein